MFSPGSVGAMQGIVREIADAEGGGNTKVGIDRAARALGLGYRRAFGFYYGTARHVAAEEWLAAERSVLAARRLRAQRLRDELAALEMIMGKEPHDVHLCDRRSDVQLSGGQVL